MEGVGREPSLPEGCPGILNANTRINPATCKLRMILTRSREEDVSYLSLLSLKNLR